MTSEAQVREQDSSVVCEAVASIRQKRKLREAFQSLDDAVSPPSSSSSSSLSVVVEDPQPFKRIHLSRSLYSTLVKYGIKWRKESEHPSSSSSSSSSGSSLDLSKSAPHLSAILARTAASRSSRSHQNVLQPPSSIRRPVHEASEYRPSSTQSFLSRLSTYKLSTYANKPAQIDAAAAAKCGWINDGKDRLACGMCGVSWVLAAPRDMSKDAANALVARQQASLVDMHKDGCPWKTRRCDDSVYRVPLQLPTVMARNLKSTALAFEPVVSDIAIEHPLTRAQLDSLRVTLTTIDDQSPGPADPSVMQVDVDTLPPPQPSDTSLVVALFGWTLVPLPNSRDRRSTSASCAGAFGPSVSVPQTPSRSRASSVSQSVRNTPRPSTRTPDRTGSSISQLQLSASPLRPRLSFRALGDMSISAAPASAKKSLSLVQCLLCQRRVGLWTFASQDDGQTVSAPPDSASLSISPSVAAARSNKVFDVVKEHRSYCPYVARSTIVPSLLLTAPASGSVSDDRDLVEGWRAVLMVVQRCGLGQRQHVARFVGNIAGEMRERDEGLGGVKTMVAGVKEKGGRELVNYVRGLLG